MNLAPVIVRELRAEARRPMTYWLRVASVVPVLLFFGMSLADRPSRFYGRLIFLGGHALMLLAILILVPTLTADCLSREKREGTLGLLFLTPLTSRAVVVGKTLAHLLRALTVWLAVAPVMLLSMLLGGIDWRDVIIALSFEASVLSLSLASGLIASSAVQKPEHNLLLAEVLSFCLALVFGSVLVDITGLLPGQRVSIGMFVLWGTSPGEAFDKAVRELVGAGDGVLSGWNALFNTGKLDPVLATSGVASGSILFGAVGIGAATRLVAWRLERTWREEPPSVRRLRLEKTWLRPRFWLTWFRRVNTRQLNRNPVAWLFTRTVGGRLVHWVWLAAALFYVSIGLLIFQVMGEIQSWFAWLFGGLTFMAVFDSASTFRREKENGALELLLVSPLRAAPVAFGPIVGLWYRYLMPALVLTFLPAFCTYFRVGILDETDLWRWIACALALLVGLPPIGAYCSLRLRSTFAAVIATLVACVVVPLALPEFVLSLLGSWTRTHSRVSLNAIMGELFEPLSETWFRFLLLFILTACFLAWRLFRLLKRRDFVWLQRSV